MTDTVSVKPTKKKKSVQIRRATPLDCVNVYRVILPALDESTVGYPKPDETKSIKWISSVIDSGVVFNAVHTGRIVGSIGFAAAQFPFAAEKESWFLSNVWFFIHKAYRSSGTAELLINQIKKFAEENNALTVFGVMMDEKAELKDRFLQTKGLTYVGGNFVYSGQKAVIKEE